MGKFCLKVSVIIPAYKTENTISKEFSTFSHCTGNDCCTSCTENKVKYESIAVHAAEIKRIHCKTAPELGSVPTKNIVTNKDESNCTKTEVN